MRHQTAVQLSAPRKSGTLGSDVSGPADRGNTEVDRLTLDIAVSEVDYLDRLAAYRNAMADVQDKKLRTRWSRKSVGENLLEEACDHERSQLNHITTELGELPPSGSSRDVVERYARKAVAVSKRHTEK